MTSDANDVCVLRQAFHPNLQLSLIADHKIAQFSFYEFLNACGRQDCSKVRQLKQLGSCAILTVCLS